MANNVEPDQTAPIGAVSSGSTLFASILKFVSNDRQLFAADDFSRRHISDAFFLGALRVKFLPDRLSFCGFSDGYHGAKVYSREYVHL